MISHKVQQVDAYRFTLSSSQAGEGVARFVAHQEKFDLNK
jgi:hypothetical protein